jgi:GT2 family glycosyltransferase
LEERDAPCIGVVIVTYAAEDFIAACLESVVASRWRRLRVVVVDNASPDGTAAAVRAWATGETPFMAPADWPLPRNGAVAKPRDFVERNAPTDPVRDWRDQPEGRAHAGPGAEVTLINAGANLGFAGGVNLGLGHLRELGEASLFWVLNPDCVIDPDAPAAFARRAIETDGQFPILSCRVAFYDKPTVIQADAGRFRPWIGFGASVNSGGDSAACAAPDMASVDYVPGMSMVVSAAFLERAGPMEASWFLYFEEIDWAFRRGDLQILFVPKARVLHRSGASIGTGSGSRAASPLSVYFMYRNMPRFLWRWFPWRMPVTLTVALLLLGRDYLWRHRGCWPQIIAGLRGLAQLGPPAAVERRLDAATWRRLRG